MNFSLPDTASAPPVPGEHGYYHAKHSADDFRTPGRVLVNYSLKKKVDKTPPWVTYQGIVPAELTRVDPSKAWFTF